MPNRLIHSTSPYLLQHAHNPVDWYPWGEEALEQAKREDKLLLISIGYAACHWCHVMEHESFTDQEVADLMNQHFVCIKIDREERPDLDKTYIEAVQLMTGQGGWPLNCVALPDGRPIWGGTYFPKSNWMNALNQLAQVYRTRKQETLQTAGNVQDYMIQRGKVLKATQDPVFSKQELTELLQNWMQRIDFKWGGRKVNANKFPVPINYKFLLKAAYFTQNERVQQALDVSLEKMAFGGIYDHLGGGFARYSVDPYWKVPHFEKMLYDNGQLVSLYAEAYHQNPSELYKTVVYDTLQFVNRELSSPEGGFYSSLDADSEGEEGKFYVWDHEEITSLLGSDAKVFSSYYNVHPFGNWEGKNVLFVLETEKDFAEQWKLDLGSFGELLARGRSILLEAREKRVRPGLDDKILCSWNALMMKGFLDAYRVFHEDHFLVRAKENAQFILGNLCEGGKLYRNYKAGKHSINAFLDDYAFLIDALIHLYQVTFELSWLHQAELHVSYVLEHFFDAESGMFFYTSDEDPLMVKRHIEVQDDVIPGSNSTLAHSLHILGILLQKPRYLEISRQMLSNSKASFLQSPDWHAGWGHLFLAQSYPYYEIAITGLNALSYRQQIDARYYPLSLYAGSESESGLPILKDRFQGQTTLYVCRDNVCQLPVHQVEEAWKQMEIS
ncbi:MAG: thioredoxin domain-containing protein [Bacteroidota bacterium]